ncbi:MULTISPECIES: peptidase [unclassified Coleofasciculus]|uniref:peptidase n=1 Tax=unclassified Coleofasciculus TaxID=2692782 RepID=UPI0018806F97|nr:MULTISPECIES: peptidase [unclassified Coleofasciculus]MBE9124784.1 peptidase [Coleofasciculus sp. LEGE 07081]MBE9147688.1 peptidase [Coleofasciculus sp. LEGE 07092]
MVRAFRKYHRLIAIAVCLPLLLTVITGMGYTIFDEWFHQDEIAEFLIGVHTFKILGLETIFPILNGLGLIGLLVTGLSMTGLFKKRSQSKKADLH